MPTPKLYKILESESGSIQRIDHAWRPKDLLFEMQTQELLADMVLRYGELEAAQGEVKGLDRGAQMLSSLKKLRLVVKRATFVRRANQLAFMQAVTEFYTVYGDLLRFLKMDAQRGRVTP